MVLPNRGTTDFDCEQAAILARFPKKRALLPTPYRRIYSNQYFTNREGIGLASRITVWLEGWMHKKVAQRGSVNGSESLLELGAGTLNHVRYEPRHSTYDIIEPFAELVQRSGRRNRVNSVYSNIWDLPSDACYPRIISIAVLEHVLDLPRLVAQSCLHLSYDGIFQAGIPSEGGLLWQLGWRLKGMPFRLSTGLDYGVLMKWEHVNDANEIQAIIEMFYDRVTCERFPLPMLNGSFYTYIEALEPKVDVARRFLSGRSAT